MQQYILMVIHQSHLGMVKCKQLARYIVFSQCMNSQIEEVVSNCATCQQHKNGQQKEPLQNREVPDFQWCDTDLFECYSDTYLVVVDTYSEYIEITTVNTTTSIAVIRVFTTHCSQITDLNF